MSTPTSQPLGVNPGHAVSPKLPAWLEVLSFPTAEPKSFVPLPPPQGGQERRQLPGAFTPHLIPAPACDVGLACGFQGEKARRGLGEVSSGVTDPVNRCPLPAIPGSSFFPHKTPWLLFPLREPRQMLKARVPLSHCEHGRLNITDRLGGKRLGEVWGFLSIYLTIYFLPDLNLCLFYLE